MNNTPSLLAPERSSTAPGLLPACRIAWASDIRLDLYAGQPHDDRDATKGGHIERLGATWARESSADLLLISGGISTAVGLAEHLTDLQRGWGKRIAFVVGRSDRWFGGFTAVADLLLRLRQKTPELIWLTADRPIELSPRCALVGIDGFYDFGEWTDHDQSRLDVDARLIAELAGMDHHHGIEHLRQHGRMNAAAGEQMLHDALYRADEVLLATHFPPWRPPWGKGPLNCAPWAIAHGLGRMIERVARNNPKKKIRVLCGDVSEACDFNVAPNLSCSTAGSVERHPAIYTTIDVPR